jgi:hemolysin III
VTETSSPSVLDQQQKPAPKPKRSIREYTPGEEIANSITHGIGALLGIVSLVAMIIVSVQAGGGVKLLSALVFGITLVLEYTNSTLYHALTNARAKKVFKILDHSSIYMLIAGTYTPFCLVALQGHGGYIVLAIVWGIAIAGIATEAFWVFRPRWSAAVLYLAMGWMIVFKAADLLAVVPQGALVMLLIGGLCYTVGIVFYLLKKVKFMHSIWHLWTIAGSAFHVIGVLFFVL